MSDKYNDMLTMNHPNSKTHKRMDRLNRAAQFAPFAALTGFDQAILETARLTFDEKELLEDSLDMLNDKLNMLNESHNNPIIKVTYYKNDKSKKGGEYDIKVGQFKNINTQDKCIIFIDNTKIYINKIYSIESELFDSYLFSI